MGATDDTCCGEEQMGRKHATQHDVPQPLDILPALHDFVNLGKIKSAGLPANSPPGMAFTWPMSGDELTALARARELVSIFPVTSASPQQRAAIESIRRLLSDWSFSTQPAHQRLAALCDVLDGKERLQPCGYTLHGRLLQLDADKLLYDCPYINESKNQLELTNNQGKIMRKLLQSQSGCTIRDLKVDPHQSPGAVRTAISEFNKKLAGIYLSITNIGGHYHVTSLSP
jgi:hypothetical protein